MKVRVKARELYWCESLSGSMPAACRCEVCGGLAELVVVMKHRDRKTLEVVEQVQVCTECTGRILLAARKFNKDTMPLKPPPPAPRVKPFSAPMGSTWKGRRQSSVTTL